MSDIVRKNLFSFLLGLALFAGPFYWIRATTVLDHLSRVGPWVVAVILGYGLVQLSFVLAWQVLLDSDAQSVRLWELFRVYLAGDVVCHGIHLRAPQESPGDLLCSGRVCVFDPARPFS